MRPSPANGIITNYTLTCSRSGVQFYEDQVNPEQFINNFDGQTTSATLMNLLPFTNYTCYITATTSAGEGDMSGPVTQATDESSEFCVYTLTMLAS